MSGFKHFTIPWAWGYETDQPLTLSSTETNLVTQLYWIATISYFYIHIGKSDGYILRGFINKKSAQSMAMCQVGSNPLCVSMITSI